MKRFPEIILRTVGTVAVLCALIGLWYNIETLSSAFSGRFKPTSKTPFLLQAFYLMSVVCILCYLTLTYLGVQLIRLKRSSFRPFTALMIFEVVYFFAVAMSWLIPGVGSSIAGGSGIANGGLMAQFILLFPLWGPLLIHWMGKNLVQTNT